MTENEYHEMIVDTGEGPKKAANPRRTMSGPPKEGWRVNEPVDEWKERARADMERIAKVDASESVKDAGSDHYKTKGVEPWDLIHDAGLNFDEGNVIKYVARHRRRNGLDDLRKAMNYLRALALDAYGEDL